MKKKLIIVIVVAVLWLSSGILSTALMHGYWCGKYPNITEKFLDVEGIINILGGPVLAASSIYWLSSRTFEYGFRFKDLQPKK